MIKLLAPYIVGAGIFATIVGGAFYTGVYWAANRAALQDAEDYQEGAKDAQDSQMDLPTSDDGNLDWLHDFIR